MNRRDFLKTIGGGAVASSALLSACTSRNADRQTPAESREPDGSLMTYRTNPNTGDRVSLLGYGMMRLLVEGGASGRENSSAPIDQDMVNRQVDYALAHGVNYFDTSPAYCQGRSERATGIALSRHPRSSYFIATKLSNFSPSTWSRRASIEMFENSLRELQTDYVDYLLLHGIGFGQKPMEEFYKRYIDNGVLDWLVEQKRKGRIRNLGFSYHGDINVFDLALRWFDEDAFLMKIADDIYNLNTIPCNECNYYMPCPYGINIPAVFSHYNRCINEGNIPNNAQDPDYRRARRAFLVGYDRSVPKLRQANHCIGCRQCVEHCPQNIQIPDEMHRIDRYVEQLKQGTL